MRTGQAMYPPNPVSPAKRIERLLRRAAMSTGATFTLPAGRYWIDLFPNKKQIEALQCIDQCWLDGVNLQKLQPLAFGAGQAYTEACKTMKCNNPETEDLGPSGLDIFRAWAKGHGAIVIKDELYEAVGHGDTWQPPRHWVLFSIEHDEPWEVAEQIGKPSPAPEGVNTSSDTADVGESPGICEEGGALSWACGPSAPSWVPWAFGGGIVLGIGLLAWRVSR